ncbi:MAG: hypothetical protein JO185_00015 [Acidobacteriaceae bacterium]|nr:hypothetical protein [Acidobacteriaceae bacterium]
MAETDPLISTEEEIKVDLATAAAIERGIRDAEEGRVTPASRVRELLPEWKEKFSIQMKR